MPPSAVVRCDLRVLGLSAMCLGLKQRLVDSTTMSCLSIDVMMAGLWDLIWGLVNNCTGQCLNIVDHKVCDPRFSGKNFEVLAQTQ